jgi:hypothetical protein
MSHYHSATDPHSQALSPSNHRQRPLSPRSSHVSDREALYLYYLRETQGDDFLALTKAGYAPGNADSARQMAAELRRRINSDCDAQSIFAAAGMGLIEWMLALDWIMHQDVKWRTIAIKSWGLAIQAYNQQQTPQGANINVNVLAAGPSGTSTGQAGLVQIAIDAGSRPADADATP